MPVVTVVTGASNQNRPFGPWKCNISHRNNLISFKGCPSFWGKPGRGRTGKDDKEEEKEDARGHGSPKSYIAMNCWGFSLVMPIEYRDVYIGVNCDGGKYIFNTPCFRWHQCCTHFHDRTCMAVVPICFGGVQQLRSFYKMVTIWYFSKLLTESGLDFNICLHISIIRNIYKLMFCTRTIHIYGQ